MEQTICRAERAARSLPLKTKEEKQILTYKSLYFDWLFFHFLWEPRTEYRKMLSPSLNKEVFLFSKIRGLSFAFRWRIQERGPGGSKSSPPYFWTKVRPEGPKSFFFFFKTGLPPPPPRYLKVWIRRWILFKKRNNTDICAQVQRERQIFP